MTRKSTEIEQAWKAYQQQLMSFIRSKVDSIDDAEDILSEVFASLIKKAASDEIPVNTSSWLYRVTRNKIVDYYRTKKKFVELADQFASEQDDVDVMRQLSGCMQSMVKTLPDTYHQVMMLSEIEGKKYVDVAHELGLTLAAVKSRILRGREKLLISLVACCTLYRDRTGHVVDYVKNKTDSCGDCDK